MRVKFRLKEDYKKSIESTPELVPLDLDSVTTFANESSIAIKLLELAKVKNITITELTPVAKLPEYTTFIKMANSAGMSTIDDIKKSLSTHESKYPDKVDSFIKTWRLKINNKSQRLVTTRDSFLRWMLFLSLDNELANKSQTWVSKNPTILESLDETRKNDSA